MRPLSFALLLLLQTGCEETPSDSAARACTEHAQCKVDGGEICQEGVCAVSRVCPYHECPAGTHCELGRCAIGDPPDTGSPGLDAGGGEGEGEGATEGEGEGPGEGEGEGAGEGEGEGATEGEGEGPGEGEGEGEGGRPIPELGSPCSRHTDCQGSELQDLTCKNLGDRKRCTYRCATSPECGAGFCCFDTGRGAYCGDEKLCRDPLICDEDADCAGDLQCFDREDIGPGARRCHGSSGVGEPCVTVWDCNPDLSDRCAWDPLARRLYCTWACEAPEVPGDPGDCPARMCCGDPVGVRDPEHYACLLGTERCDLSLPCEQRDDPADAPPNPDDGCNAAHALAAEGYAGVLCGADEDWYSLDVLSGQSAFISLEWPDEEAVADPDLELRRLDCGYIVEAVAKECRPPGDGEELPRCTKTVSLKAPERGRYLFVVRGLPLGQELTGYSVGAQLGCMDHADCRLRQDRGPSCQRAGADVGLCVDTFPCRDDDDCIGTKVCDQGTVQCIQPCQPDRFDREGDNDDCGPSAELVALVDGQAEESGLTICPTDEDWFVVGLAEGDGLEARIDHLEAAGGLEVAIFATNCLNQLRVSIGEGDARRARLEAAPAAGNYFVRVQGGLNIQNEYSVRFRVREGGFCADDVAEEDDHPTLAQIMDGLPIDGPDVTVEDRKGCEEDDDWFRIPLLRAERLLVFLDNQVGEAEGNLDLELFGPGEPQAGAQPIAFASSEENGDELVAQVPADGDYYLRIHGGLDATYSVSFRREAAPCEDDELEPNQDFDNAVPIAVGAGQVVQRDARFCTGNADWWRVFLDVGEGLEATVCVDDPAAADLALGLFDADGAELVASDEIQTACETIVLRPAPAAGDYGLVISSAERGEAAYTLTLTIEEACADDDFEPNERNINPPVILPGTHSLRRCGGNVDWFRVDKSEGATLWLDVIARPVEPPLRLTLFNRNGASVLSDRDPVRPGESAAASSDNPFGRAEPHYMLRVQSEDVGAVYDYSLIIREVPPIGDCVDDDYEPDDSLVRTPDRAAGEHVDRRICPGNPDHYPVAVAAGQTVAAELSFDHRDGDLSLILVGPDGVTEEARSEGNQDTEFVALPTPARAPKRYVVRVEGARPDVANSYTLTLTLQ